MWPIRYQAPCVGGLRAVLLYGNAQWLFAHRYGSHMTMLAADAMGKHLTSSPASASAPSHTLGCTLDDLTLQLSLHSRIFAFCRDLTGVTVPALVGEVEECWGEYGLAAPGQERDRLVALRMSAHIFMVATRLMGAAPPFPRVRLSRA